MRQLQPATLQNTMAIGSSPDKKKDTSLAEGTCIES
jgi:hypothetical protein